MRRFVVVGLLALLLPACSSTDPWDPGIPNIPRTDVYVANFSSEQVREVYLRPAGESAWGENWLAHPINAGNLYAYVGEVISGSFDVRMVGQLSSREVSAIQLVGEYVAVSFTAQPTAAE